MRQDAAVRIQEQILLGVETEPKDADLGTAVPFALHPLSGGYEFTCQARPDNGERERHEQGQEPSRTRSSPTSSL